MIIHIISIYVANPVNYFTIIALYELIYFKEAKRIKDIRWIFIMFVI